MKNSTMYRMGVDVGSTTLKIIILNHTGEIIYKTYLRHKTDFNTLFIEELNQISEKMPDTQFAISITGSAGMGISERTGIPFVQEVVSSMEVVRSKYPSARSLIDIGGEDAKLVLFEEGHKPDIRMNGSCAGGTGAFIDQMADLMNITVNELGKQALAYEKLYPVASRCGVFAKTDVQNMIARNLPIPDIAMSILNAVALQCITSLARGTEIQPQVICIGGPLTFIPALRYRFSELLDISDQDMILPDNSPYFPALGAALHADKDQKIANVQEIIEKLTFVNSSKAETLPALFESEDAYRKWQENRKIVPLKFRKLIQGEDIACFLGIDSGSTTTKIVVMDQDTHIVFQYYSPNEGNSLKKVVEGLEEFYKMANAMQVSFRFVSSAATGYGEDLIKSALNLDYGIVETMAHLSGAQYVDPEVSFVLDIGGQDMKSIFTNKGVISNIELNESCSSGCGSFLQNFASTMNLSLSEFTRLACLSQHPCDLGTRCTVFMNSKVKQSLRQNASLGDISAGLAYSVVKNCLFKVLKISNLNQLGDHIVVQGGTFRNDAVYRALELLSGKSISSTDFPELMGAVGTALYARNKGGTTRHSSTFSGMEKLPDVTQIQTKEIQCKGCTNSCSVLQFHFENGNKYYAGNKCEKYFFNQTNVIEKGFNAFEMKNELLFTRVDKSKYVPDRKKNRIGIPRVLNMYENYPFWYTLFTECGFEVVLSEESTFSLYQKGVGSVMSDNICFPAKLVHGHIYSLLEKGVDRIFYPMVPKEYKEFDHTTNSYNCPVVSGYPEVIRSAMNTEDKNGIPFDKPVISMQDNKTLKKASWNYFSTFGIPKIAFENAFKKALQEREHFFTLLLESQKERLDKAVLNGDMVFIVAGRPYHADPLVHQKVGQILSDLGITVLTDDVFRIPESEAFQDVKLVSQWSYPNRTVQAAMEVAKLPHNIQYIQLNSFGCGPDSFFMDEIGNILKNAGKNHTIIRIDEIASPGSIRLRLRSLIESLKMKSSIDKPKIKQYIGYERTYTKEDRKKTILVPWFADFLSPFIPPLGELLGYKIVNLPKPSKSSADAGLKYGHNEVCYPSTLILGDIIAALQSGNYDPDNVVVAITQTGGQCRATNYLAQVKSGLESAGFNHVPVVIVATGGVFQNEQKAFKLPILKIVNIIIYALLYADAIQQMYSSTVVKEKVNGTTESLFNHFIQKGVEAVQQKNKNELLNLLKLAVNQFNAIDIYEKECIKVGLIGEIYLKYNSYGQAHITNWMRSNGVEVVTPPFLDFMMQYFVNSEVNIANGINQGNLLSYALNPVLLKYMNVRISKFEEVMKAFRFHEPTKSVFVKSQYASEILDLSNQFGEGWMIAAEVACFAREGINRVVCVQPFGCIANHIVAKGIEKRIKVFYPKMNLLYLDMDDGMADVHMQNRLHFLIN